MLICFTARNTRRLYLEDESDDGEAGRPAALPAQFNLVGGIGIAVQLLIFLLLERDCIWLSPCTPSPVEGAVVHKLLWHDALPGRTG